MPRHYPVLAAAPGSLTTRIPAVGVGRVALPGCSAHDFYPIITLAYTKASLVVVCVRACVCRCWVCGCAFAVGVCVFVFLTRVLYSRVLLYSCRAAVWVLCAESDYYASRIRGDSSSGSTAVAEDRAAPAGPRADRARDPGRGRALTPKAVYDTVFQQSAARCAISWRALCRDHARFAGLAPALALRSALCLCPCAGGDSSRDLLVRLSNRSQGLAAYGRGRGVAWRGMAWRVASTRE